MYYNPYEGITAPDAKWQKMQMHAHAGVLREHYCGIYPTAYVVEAYKNAGYDGIAITNHDLYMPYNMKREDISLIDGVEYSLSYHTLLYGVNRYQYEGMTHQEIIDYTLSQGGFVVIAHPDYKGYDYWPIEDMEKLTGYVGVEVIRAPMDSPGEFNGAAGFTIGKWDHLLTKGRQVYAFGNDDFHTWKRLNKAWNMVYAKSAGFKDIKEAVEAGRFYATTGAELDSFGFDGKRITVKAKPDGTYTYRFIGSGGKLLGEVKGEAATHEVNPDEIYVRTEVINQDQQIMFLQPVFRNV